MRCPYCGRENPEVSVFCSSCGRELPARPVNEPPPSPRQCASCGRALPMDAYICPYCGRDHRVQQTAAVAREQLSDGMRILLYLASFFVPIAGLIIGAIYFSKGDPESERVGKICFALAVVGLVLGVIAVALSLALFSDLSGTPTDMTPLTNLTRSTVSDGFKFSFLAFTRQTSWSDITIILSDNFDFVDWSPSSAQLSRAPAPATERFVPVQFGFMTVFCNVTDQNANGIIDGGDFFTLTTGSNQTFSSTNIYTVTVVHEPTGGMSGQITFTG